jgi:nucleotide-binding universal stress UspA family protein
MTIKCPVCGSHVPKDVAVELTVGDQFHSFCSARCADTAISEGTAFVPPPPLPPLPRRILVAVDGSGPSLRAVAAAGAIAATGHGELRLLCAVDSGWTGALRMLARGVGQPDMSAEVERALREDAQAQLDYCRRMCEHAGIPTTTAVVFKPPFEAIIEAASDADLVVMGSRGRGALAGLVLGSLSQRVLGATRTPVLIAH